MGFAEASRIKSDSEMEIGQTQGAKDTIFLRTFDLGQRRGQDYQKDEQAVLKNTHQ